MILPAPQTQLDVDQSAALQRFTDDLNSVLAAANVPPEYFKRSTDLLAAAYQAALVTGKWSILVAILAETLDDLSDRERVSKKSLSSQYRRLLAIVHENADLLPPEMLGKEAAACEVWAP